MCIRAREYVEAHQYDVADVHIRQGDELRCDRLRAPDSDGRAGGEADNLLACRGPRPARERSHYRALTQRKPHPIGVPEPLAR